jgi:dynein heavy chain
VLKIWRYEKLLFAITEFVKQQIGEFYIKAPPSSMEDVFPATDVTTPFIYVLSVGADPTSILNKFAIRKNYFEKLNTISLGQGQGPKAEALVERAKKQGEWVMLQNCHLAKSWISEALENIVNDFAAQVDTIDPNFRLFLTSMPVDYFPVSVLQNGVKLTTEPPRGLKNNLRRSYNEITEKQIEESKPYVKKMIFGLCFFHAQVQERRKFGPLGWNIRYEFNDSDLDTALTMLPLLMEDQEDIPWDSLNFIIGKITYGGRVTDELDERCLLSNLGIILNPRILEDDHKFSDSGIYYAPNDGTLKTYQDYIDTLPLKDEPEVFGMHPNTNINFQLQESDRIVKTVVGIQPRESVAAGAKSPDELIIEKCIEIQEQLPEILERSEGKKELFKTDAKGLLPSLSTVLTQEISRFNALLKVMGLSLSELVKAIKGITLMSKELDTMYFALTNGVVPPNWEKVAYPSLKPFASWFLDLIERVTFMRNWLVKGEPPCFWMSGFFFPQGFMTGVLQTHARKEQIAIDKLNFSFKTLDEDWTTIEESPEAGVYVYGLFFDGARWDEEAGMIAEQFPGILYYKAPTIWFEPIEGYKIDPEEYSCPVYKTSVRAGVLSTTGQSTNFVLSVELPSKQIPSHWIRRGAALICNLND